MVRQAPPESVYSVMSDSVSGWLMRIEVRPEDLHALPAVRAVGDDDAPAGLEIERARFEQASFLEPDLDDLAERLGLRVDSIHRVGAAVEHERGAVGSPLEREGFAESAGDVRGKTAARFEHLDAEGLYGRDRERDGRRAAEIRFESSGPSLSALTIALTRGRSAAARRPPVQPLFVRRLTGSLESWAQTARSVPCTPGTCRQSGPAASLLPSAFG